MPADPTGVNFLRSSDQEFLFANADDPDLQLFALTPDPDAPPETWTRLVLERYVADYLISNLGRLWQVSTNRFVENTYSAGITEAYFVRLADTENQHPYNRIPKQRLVAFSFKKIPQMVRFNPELYQVVHIDGNTNSLVLDELYFVAKSGRSSRYNLRQVLKMRQLYQNPSINFDALERRFDVSHRTVSNIINNRTWIVAE